MAQDEKAPAKDAAAPATGASQPVTVNIVQPDRAAEGARAMADGRALEMDKTVPGGRYRVGDAIVNADGKPIEEKPAGDQG